MASVNFETEQLVGALRAVLPDVGALAMTERINGWANDRWIVQSDIGPLLAKVRSRPEEDERQIEGQLRAQRWLQEIGFPTPELLYLAWKCPELDGRQFSVQRYVEGAADLSDELEAMDPDARVGLFGEIGNALGRLHAFDLPEFPGWIDDSGRSGESWADTIRPVEALRCVRDDGSLVSSDLLGKAERRIEEGLALIPSGDVVPRLVHRDLHFGNMLGRDGHFEALLDFEMVREWDFVFDFRRIESAILPSHTDCREAFFASYQDAAGPLPESFELRKWTYDGIGLVLQLEDLIDGNDAYANTPAALAEWLRTPAPVG